MIQRTALLIVDAQVNQFDPAHPVADAAELLSRLESLVARARAADLPVLFVRNCGGDGEPDVLGTPGWEIHPALRPMEGEGIVDKTQCDAFEGTPLAEQLRARDVGTLVVAGVQSDFCIRATALGALARGYEVTLVSDAHKAFALGGSPAEQSAAVNDELRGRVKLVKADELSLL